MTTWFVSRHSGAVDWCAAQEFAVDRVVTHLDPDHVKAGDQVIGSLPVHLAAAVCARGGRYYHLRLDVPPERRGDELTRDDMNAFGAQLEEYQVLRTTEEGEGHDGSTGELHRTRPPQR